MLKVIKSKLRVISLVIFLDLSKYNLQGSLPVYSRRSVPNMCKYRLNHRACTFVETLRYAGRGWHCKSTDTIVNTSSAASTTLRSYHLQFCWYPSSFVFVSLVLLHVPFDLPGFLFSGKVHFNILIFDGILLFFIVFQSVKQWLLSNAISKLTLIYIQGWSPFQNLFDDVTQTEYKMTGRNT